MTFSILAIIGLIVITDLFDTVGQLILKANINRIDAQVRTLKEAIQFLFRLARIPQLWASLILSLSSLLVWLFVLSKADLNVAYSIDSMRYIFIALASSVFLKEKIGVMRTSGILAIVFGIILVTLS